MTSLSAYLPRILEDFRGLTPQAREARIHRALVASKAHQMNSNQLVWSYDPRNGVVTIEDRYFDAPAYESPLSAFLAALREAGALRSNGI